MENHKPAKFTENLGNTPITHWLYPLTVVIATSVSFLPVLSNGFVEWDDLESLIENPYYRGLGWDQVRWMFTTFLMGPYQPLSWLTFGLDYWLWGMNPVGYHLTNLIIHTANAVFFYFISRQLLSMALSKPSSQADWRLNLSAVVSALVFAIHPLRVESVAWATERRDVLSGFFYLWTLVVYLRAQSTRQANAPARRWMYAGLAVYLLSLLSKATAITLPLVLLLIDIYPLKRLAWNPWRWFGNATRNVLAEKLPFVLVASVFAAIAWFGQQHVSAFRSLDSYGVTSRLNQTLFGASFYLWKTLVPWNLSPLYEIPPEFNPWNLRIIVGAMTTITITLALYRFRFRWPAGLACWLYYLIVLSPFLGIIQAGPQLVADRYSYLSCMSWAVLAGGMLCYALGYSSHRAAVVRFTWGAVAIAGLILLASFTWNQTQFWRDTATLWNRVLELDPKSSIAHYNLARFLAREGKETEAISHYRQALSIRPNDPDAHNNLGLLLARQGQVAASLREFRKAAEINPAYAKAFFNIGRVLAREGDLDNAVRNYKHALALSPREAEIHLRLGTVLAARGNVDEAIHNLQEALRLRPDSADAHVALARILAAQGRSEQAEFHYRAALQLLKARPGAALPP